MALSNWDTLAFGPDAQACNGVFESLTHPGDSIEIYKNWIYVRSRDMWKDGRSYTEPTIAQIQSGDTSILSFEIEVIRGSQQNAIFVFAKEFVYSDKKESEEGWFKPYYRRFGGIGCYGYDEDKWLGVTPETLKEFFDWLLIRDGGTETAAKEHLGMIKELIEQTAYEGEPKMPLPTLEEALEECKDKEHREWVAKCMQASPLRFNQGDAYFAQHFETAIPATNVGKTETPMIERMMKK